MMRRASSPEREKVSRSDLVLELDTLMIARLLSRTGGGWRSCCLSGSGCFNKRRPVSLSVSTTFSKNSSTTWDTCVAGRCIAGKDMLVIIPTQLLTFKHRTLGQAPHRQRESRTFRRGELFIEILKTGRHSSR